MSHQLRSRGSVLQRAIRTVRSSRKKCAFCLRNIVDPGSLLLSKVNQDNLIYWCEIMLKLDSKDVMEVIKSSWVCIFCIWDARFYHEHAGGSKNTVWWSTGDKIYKFYERNMIKPCSLSVKKLTDFQIHHWTEAAGKKKFKCVVCGFKNGTDNAMYLHMLKKHPEKKIIKCKLCKEYVDITVIGMQVHIDEIHKGEISTSLKTKFLKCQLCDKIFTGQGRKYHRSQHLKLLHPNAAVRCAWFGCCRYFRTQAAMENHAKEQHNDVMAREKARCIFCAVEYLENYVLSAHVRKKHKLEAHFCPRSTCSKYYKTNAEMQAHVKEVHENVLTDEKIACAFCKHITSTIRLHVHMREKHLKEAFKCKRAGCNIYFPTKEDALKHYKTAHPKGKYYKYVSCDICLKTFSSSSIELHIVTRHFPRTLKCPECPKLFASESHIHEHARKTHSKSRKKCPHCKMTPSLYNAHVVNTKCFKCLKPFKCFALMRKHQSKCHLTFNCDLCNKDFKMEAHLLNHFKRHRKINKNVWLGAKNFMGSAFKCDPCKIHFAHEGFLNKHLRYFHMDTKNCICHVCGKLVRCKSRMEYHLVNVHSILKRQVNKQRRIQDIK